MTDDESGLPRDRLWQPVTAKWFFVIFGLCLAYAILRYHIAGTVPWEHFPLFILNKATSLAAVFLVGASYLVGGIIKWHNHDPVIRLVVVKFCGLLGFFMAGMHALFSYPLLIPPYFAKYFTPDGRLNIYGEVAVATGVVGLFALMSPAITTLPMMPKAIGGKRWKRSQRLGYVALILVAVHLWFLGIKGWMKPQDWTAGLPPISLVAFVAALVPLFAKLKRERTKAAARADRE
jgi:DMSO/TMAO reductase YedYZ heme-binding membrane subunit